MAKAFHDDVLDGSPNIIKNNCTRITVCSAQPTTYTEGNATYALADVTVDSSDFTNGNGDVSGRKLTVGAQSTVTVDTPGTATHVAYLDVTNSKLLGCTTCSSTAVAGTVNIGAHDVEFADPT